jgi:hypothetical protein
MSKGWRVIGAIVLVLVLLGAICIGVGFMTGGDVADIFSTLSVRYNLAGYWEQWSQWAVDLYNQNIDIVRGLF